MRDELLKCELLGDEFGYLVQIVLAAASFSALIFKRFQEKPRRPWGIWARDSSKQCLGGLLTHAWNMLFALMLVSSRFDNPCIFYFAQYLLADNLLGILFNWLVLKSVVRVATRYGSNLLDSGYYGDPPSYRIWFLQLVVWLCVVSVVKIILFFGFLLPFRTHLYKLGKFALRPLQKDPRAELVVVMILVPLVVNGLQFWIQDNFLRHDPAHTASHARACDLPQDYGSTDHARPRISGERLDHDSERRALLSDDVSLGLGQPHDGPPAGARLV